MFFIYKILLEVQSWNLSVFLIASRLNILLTLRPHEKVTNRMQIFNIWMERVGTRLIVLTKPTAQARNKVFSKNGPPRWTLTVH